MTPNPARQSQTRVEVKYAITYAVIVALLAAIAFGPWACARIDRLNTWPGLTSARSTCLAYVPVLQWSQAGLTRELFPQPCEDTALALAWREI